MLVVLYLLILIFGGIALAAYLKKHPGYMPRFSWAGVCAFWSSPLTLFALALIMRGLFRGGGTYEIYSDVAVLLIFGAGALVVLLVRSVLVIWAALCSGLGVSLFSRDRSLDM